MTYFYVDIESEGFNPKEDKIITIQYQRLDYEAQKIDGELIILKEWESNEEQIVTQFYNLLTSDKYFTPIMTNHYFDFNFLIEKFKKYGLIPQELEKFDFLYSRFLIDIHSTLVIINNMKFKGSGLDKLTNKEFDGSIIPLWYEQKKYAEIEQYIIKEAEAFLKAFFIIRNHLCNLNLK